MFEVEDGIAIPIASKEVALIAARKLYTAGGVSKAEAARQVLIVSLSGFTNTERDSAIQYLVRRI